MARTFGLHPKDTGSIPVGSIYFKGYIMLILLWFLCGLISSIVSIITQYNTHNYLTVNDFGIAFLIFILGIPAFVIGTVGIFCWLFDNYGDFKVIEKEKE